MFAITFATLVKTRIQQNQQVKQERQAKDQTAVKKSLVPDIARRGIVALAIMVLGVSSAHAGKFGGGTGGGAGAGFPRKASSFGNVNNQQTIKRTDSIPVKPVQQQQKVDQIKNVEPIKQVQNSDAVRRVDTIKNGTDSIKKDNISKTLGDKPAELGKKIDGAKPINLGKNLDLPKNPDLKKIADLKKTPDLSRVVKPGNNGALSKAIGPNNKKVNGKLVDAIKAGRLDSLTNGAAAKKLGVGEQFKLMDKGDIARRLKLSDKLAENGGWKKRMCGPIDPHYTDHCKGRFYYGPKWCPHHCWCPMWCGWVEWSFDAPMWFDPRPDFCEPVEAVDYQVEEPVVINREGTPDSWVDDEPPAAQEGTDQADVDLELIAIRFVDNGNVEKNIGPRYRVLIRNNGKQPVDHPFNVAAVLGATEEPTERTPRAGKRVEGIDAGQTIAVDIRLPVEANTTAKDADGHSVAQFPKLGVMVDTRNEVEEQNKENNGMALDRDSILMVDPVVFAADSKQVTLGQEIDLAGEGLGPEAGQVLVKVGNLELQAEIEGWYDLGVRIKMPSLPLAGDTKAELVVIRGDGAAANPMALAVAATQSAPPAPVEE